MSFNWRFIILAFMAAALTGCGQKGPLYLPESSIHGSL